MMIFHSLSLFTLPLLAATSSALTLPKEHTQALSNVTSGNAAAAAAAPVMNIAKPKSKKTKTKTKTKAAVTKAVKPAKTTSAAASATSISCPQSNGSKFTTGGSVFQVQCYQDHFGGDMSNYATSTFSDCMTLCANTKNCVDVSYSGGMCYMKDSIQPIQLNSAVWGAQLVSTISTPKTTTSTTTKKTSTTTMKTSTTTPAKKPGKTKAAKTTTAKVSSTLSLSSTASTSSMLFEPIFASSMSSSSAIFATFSTWSSSVLPATTSSSIASTSTSAPSTTSATSISSVSSSALSTSSFSMSTSSYSTPSFSTSSLVMSTSSSSTNSATSSSTTSSSASMTISTTTSSSSSLSSSSSFSSTSFSSTSFLSTSSSTTQTSTTTTIKSPFQTTIVQNKMSTTTNKRGLAYNDPSLTYLFGGSSSQVSWLYDWGQDLCAHSNPDFTCLPMLWSDSPDLTATWDATVKAAVNNGMTRVLGFNEPDYYQQANMAPKDAAKSWIKYMQPYASMVELGGPAITGQPSGLVWLQQFYGNLTHLNCTAFPDFQPVHWYDQAWNIGWFKIFVTEAYQQTGVPIWITEFQGFGTDAQQATFFETVSPWLDANEWVGGYAYFGVFDDNLVNFNGTNNNTSGWPMLSATGQAFDSYYSKTVPASMQ